MFQKEGSGCMQMERYQKYKIDTHDTHFTERWVYFQEKQVKK